MNYKETINYLFERLPMFQRVGASAYKKDLTNTLALCALLDNPHQQFPSVHIAGTNGKGSVTHLIASILQEAGYKVGVYISPHYKDFRERIKINGNYISEQAVMDFVEKMKPAIEEIEPSFFEITVAMAFDYFRNEQVDIAVVEVGMGGRLDSTNVLNPLLSVITNISYDHQQFLGDTLPLIAAEKAGIIKPETPIVIGEEQEETKQVFIHKAQTENAPLQFASQLYEVKTVLRDNHYQYIDVFKNKKLKYTKIPCALLGAYQQKNIGTSLTAVDSLIQSGWKISETDLLNGIKNCIQNTHIIGRWQLLGTKPLCIADSAHNEGGLRWVKEELKNYKYTTLRLVYGTVKDKDLSKVFPLLPPEAVYYFACPDIPRGLDANILAANAAAYHLSGKAFPTVRHAFEQACRDADPENDLVLVVGSIFVVAEVL